MNSNNHADSIVGLYPKRNRVLVREYKANSPIAVPEGANPNADMLWRGVVMAVGPGVRSLATGELVPVDIEVGEFVFYRNVNGKVVITGPNGEDVVFAILDEAQVLLSTGQINTEAQVNTAEPEVDEVAQKYLNE